MIFLTMFQSFQTMRLPPLFEIVCNVWKNIVWRKEVYFTFFHDFQVISSDIFFHVNFRTVREKVQIYRKRGE